MEHHAKKRTSSDHHTSELLKNSLFGAILSLLTGTVLLFLSAAICYSAEEPNRLILPLGLCTLYLMSIPGGFFAARKNGRAPLLCGLLCGTVLFLLFLLISLLLPASQNTPRFGLSLLLRTLILPCSVLGSLFGSKPKASPRKHRRHQ